MSDNWIQFGMLFIAFIGGYFSITKEMKDFHGRLCSLEEKYIQMMERFLENKK